MNFNGQTVLSGLALFGLVIIALVAERTKIDNGALQLLSTIVGALAGAVITTAGGQRAEKITNSSGPGATVQPDAPDKRP